MELADEVKASGVQPNLATRNALVLTAARVRAPFASRHPQLHGQVRRWADGLLTFSLRLLSCAGCTCAAPAAAA